MKKITTIFMMFWALVANAQIDNLFPFNTSNQQIVQSAVENAFVAITSSYRLQDPKTKKLYGRNGNDNFGTISSWGLKIDGGIMLPDQAVRPWEYDPNYSKYRDKYNTVPYQISFQKSEGKIVLDSIDVKVCNAQNLFYSIKDTLVANGEGFKIDSSDGEKDGWIIWLTEENDSINTFLVFKKKIEFKPNDNVYEVEQPNTMKKILAGIYVVPSYEAIGIVSFNLCGILVEQNEKWDLARISILPNETSNPSKVKVRTPVVQEDRDTELTLIESNKKKDKNKKDRK